MEATTVDALAQFGVAGLMGVLWMWERFYSRKREQELTQAHQLLIEQKVEFEALLKLVQRNTAAIERFEQTQERIAELLEKMADARRAA